MQVVSKWHNIGATGYTGKSRVERIARVSKAKPDREEQQSAKPFVVAAPRTDAHTLISAQVVATRFSDAFDLSFDRSNHMAGAAAYEAALDRKIHRMAQGSFYQEAV